MSRDDLPAAMLLKQSAGWNQTPQDWANVQALEPEGCWVYEAEGKVAGSTTAVCYGQELAWIGMVLVLPEFRGRGYGRAMMEHALRFLEQRGVRAVRLDATDMGHPLYAKLGFRDECAIERWSAPTGAKLSSGNRLQAEGLDSAAAFSTLDRRAFGADRLAVLERLAGCFPASGLCTSSGFGMTRPGSEAHFLGPCVAEEAATARGLIETLLSRHAGHAVFWDLLPENTAAVQMARELGFQCRRRLVRMVRGDAGHAAATRGDTALQFATAGFEYG